MTVVRTPKGTYSVDTTKIRNLNTPTFDHAFVCCLCDYIDALVAALKETRAQ